MEAIGLTASLIAILELCGKTILYIQTARGGSKQKAQLMTEIQSLQLVTGQLHDVSDDVGWKKTMEILAEPGAPLKLLEETLRSLVQKLGPNAGLRRGLDVVLWPFQEKEVNSILAMIERQKASLSLALENNSRLLQDRIASQVDSNHNSLEELKTICGGLHEEIKTVKRSLEQSKARETLQWITKLNFGPRHDTILQSWDRKTGTGTWILRHPLFIEWTASKTTATKLWCHGIPGAGKSVIAAIVFDHLRESLKPSNQYVSVATLYCDHEQRADQNLDELERSILHQALADCATIPTALQDLREETKDGFSPSLSKLHSAIASSPAASQTLFVVLDALDEASEIVQDQLVDRISALPFREVRILCTSRTWPKFEKAFAGLPQIQISASDDDIEMFVRKKLEDGARLRNFLEDSSSLRDQVLSNVLARTKGSFLMAKYHMDDLSLAQTKKKLRQKLERLPDKMQDAYHLTMERVQHQPGPDKTLAIRTLSLVFGAKHQLTIRSIQVALAIITLYKDDEDDESDGVEEDDLPSEDIIVQCCQGLLLLEGETRNRWGNDIKDRRILRASHYTANEYFRQRYVEWFPDGHVLLATACCYSLSQPSLQNDAIKSYSSIMWFSHYAGHYWGVHFWEAWNQLPNSLKDHVMGLMKSWFTERPRGGGSWREEEVTSILAPFRVISRIDRRRCNVDAVDNKLERLLSNILDDGDIPAANFLLELPGLEIDAMGPDFDRMLRLAVKLRMDSLTQRLLRALTLDKRLAWSGDGELSRRLQSFQKTLLAELFDERAGHDNREFLLSILRTLQDLDPRNDRAVLLYVISENASLAIHWLYIGSDLNLEATDALGNTLLHLAAEHRSSNLIKYLLEQNLNSDVLNTEGKSPCQVAIDKHNFCNFLQLLPTMSTSTRCLLFDTTDTDSILALIGPAWPGRDLLPVFLSEARTGHFESATDAENRTVLCLVLRDESLPPYDRLEAIGLLLDLGADVNFRDNDGMTALSHMSVNWYGLKSCCEKLIDAGADPNARDNNGMTPILYVASRLAHSHRQRLEMIRILLRGGANAYDRDSSGVSVVGHVVNVGGYARDDALEVAQAWAKKNADRNNEFFSRAFLAFKHLLIILWLLLGNKDLDRKALVRVYYGAKGHTATLRLINLVKFEKDALEKCYQSDEPLEWLGRTQIEKRLKEEIWGLCNMAGFW